MLLCIIRGKQPDFTDLFVAFKESKLALTLVLSCLVANILTALGFVALIIPGIYLMIAYTFVFIIIIDRRVGVWEALELSRKTVTGQWWRVFALLLLLFIIMVLGMLACCVGSLIAVPICIASLMYAYETLFSGRKNQTGD